MDDKSLPAPWNSAFSIKLLEQLNQISKAFRSISQKTWFCNRTANADSNDSTFSPLLLLYNLPQTDCSWAYVCMDTKGLWKPGLSFILVGFTLFSSSSVPCGTGAPLQNWWTELVHILTRETSCDPAPHAQLCGSSCKHSPSIVLLVIFSHGPVANLTVSLMLACLGTPDLITVLVFSVSWQTICYENALSSLSPINLLLLLDQGWGTCGLH